MQCTPEIRGSQATREAALHALNRQEHGRPRISEAEITAGSDWAGQLPLAAGRWRAGAGDRWAIGSARRHMGTWALGRSATQALLARGHGRRTDFVKSMTRFGPGASAPVRGAAGVRASCDVLGVSARPIPALGHAVVCFFPTASTSLFMSH